MDTSKNIDRIATAGRRQFRSNAPRLASALACSTLLLSGCYVMPIGTSPDGQQQYVYSTVPVVPGRTAANDLANQTGVLTGQVTNMMSGKGRFQFSYQGESLVGEATRVSGEERRGVASAYGSRGTFARCDYQMSTPYQGAGSCTFSNGASYQLHIGS